MKEIDAPLAESYVIAVLNKDHSDRLFLMFDPYRNRLTWSRLYRPAVLYSSVPQAQETLAEVHAGEHPQLLDESAAIDPQTLCLLKTEITFRTEAVAG